VPEEVLAVAGVLEGVGFEPGGPALEKRSFPLLDRLAAVLVQHPSVRGRIVVACAPEEGPAGDGASDGAEGEAEEEAEDDGGRARRKPCLDLAQARAEAVRYYLSVHGVSELRLGAVGVDVGEAEGEGMVVRRWLAEFDIRRRELR
jgi:hypothetical protein